MSNQHFLPASYIGRFSLDSSGPWRKRKVWVQRVNRKPFAASAEYVGYRRKLYDRQNYGNDDNTTFDGNWNYEPRLPKAISALDDASTPLDGHLWAEVLVPFISSLFIRGIDFPDRFESRLPELRSSQEGDSAIFDAKSWYDNTLMARHIEWQRILAPVMSARWTVVHGSGSPVLATNDTTHCLMVKQGDESEQVSYAFPITTSSVLVLEQCTVRRVLDWNGTAWTAPIAHRNTTDDDLIKCRQAIQHAALREVYGPTKEVVAFPSLEFQPTATPVGPWFLSPHPRARYLLPYVEDYFRLLTLLTRSPSQYPSSGDSIDWNVVSRSWSAAVQVFVNFPRFPGGLAVTAFAAYLDLSRFTMEDVERSIGKKEIDPTLVSQVPSETLKRLILEDMRRGTD